MEREENTKQTVSFRNYWLTQNTNKICTHFALEQMNGRILSRNRVQLLCFHMLAVFHWKQLQRVNEKFRSLIRRCSFRCLHLQCSPGSAQRNIDKFPYDCVGVECGCIEFYRTGCFYVDYMRYNDGNWHFEQNSLSDICCVVSLYTGSLNLIFNLKCPISPAWCEDFFYLRCTMNTDWQCGRINFNRK